MVAELRRSREQACFTSDSETPDSENSAVNLSLHSAGAEFLAQIRFICRIEGKWEFIVIHNN